MHRIVFLTAARQVWGAEESLLSIATECARRGIPTALVAFGGEVAERFASATGGDVYCVAHGAPASEQKIRENALLWSVYWRHARRGDRLAIFTYYLAVPTLVMRPVARAMGVRIGLDLHDNLPGVKGRRLLAAVTRGVDAVTACSSYTASQLPRHPGVRALHGPVDDRPYRPSSRGAGTLVVGVVGRITANKGHLMVIDAVAAADEPMVLVVRGAGDGTEADNSEQVRARGREVLGERFRDDGRVPADRALDGLDVVVVGNSAEPMGRTVIEAQLQGVVAVVPDAGGASELVQDGVTGFVYPAGDSPGLARVLERIASADGLDDMRTRARQAVVDGTALPGPYTDAYLRALG